MSIETLIAQISEESDASETFQQIMFEKIASKLEQKKHEVMDSLFQTTERESE